VSSGSPQSSHLVLGGRYQLGRLLGRGGFGTVYAAHDDRLGAPVAIKVLSRVGPQAVVRFKEEFRRAASLVHPGLVVLHELAFEARAPGLSDEPFWYFTMDLVDGEDLASRLGAGAPQAELTRSAADSALLAELGTPHSPGGGRRRGLPFAEALPLLRDIASALEFMHRSGVAHCDLKPSNVIITRATSRAVLVDFGLATALDGERRVKGGTPHYMPPELSAGGHGLPATDTYALGVLIFEVLTGRLPFEGDARAMLALKRTASAPRLASFADCPPALDALVASLLSIEPGDRPSAATVVQALNALSSGELEATQVWPRRVPPPQQPLLGRETRLAACLEALGASEGHVVIALGGPAGIGKTALAKELTRRRDGLVISAVCHERERSPLEVIDGLASSVSTAFERLAVTPPHGALAHLAVVAPSLMVRLAERGAEVTSRRADPRAQHALAVAALAELLAALREHADLTLWLEDLHCLDADGHAFLAELFSHRLTPPLRTIVTARPGASHGERWLTALAVDPGCGVFRFALEPLDESTARALVQNLAGGQGALSEPLVRRLVLAAEGNALLLEQFVEHALASQPHGDAHLPSLATIVDARVSALAPGARELLELLAISAHPVPAAVLVRAAGLLPGAPASARHVSALHALTSVRLLQQGTAGDEVVLRHAALGPATLAAVPATRLAALHQAMAESFVERGGAPELVAELVARHFVEASLPQRASTWLEAAATRAMSRLAFERALELDALSRGLGISGAVQRVSIAARRGAALSALGRGVESAAEFGAAAALVESPAAALELGRRSAEELLRSGRIAEGLACLDTILERLGTRRPRTRLGALWLLARSQLCLRLSGGLDASGGEAGRDTPEAALRADAAWTLATTLGFVDPLLAAAYSSVHAVETTRSGGGLRRVRALGSEAISVSGRGDGGRSEVSGHLSRMEQLAERVGGPSAAAYVAGARGVTSALLGDFATSFESCARAAQLFETEVRDAPWNAATNEHFYLWAAVERGRLDTLVERAPARYEEARSRGDHYAASGLGAHYANLAWLVRDVGQARKVVSECASLWEREQFSLPLYDVAMATTHLELWDGAVSERTVERLERLFTSLRRAFYFQVEAVRVDAGFLRARASVAAIAHASSEAARRRARRRAGRHIAFMRSAKLGIAHPLASLLELAVRRSLGRDDVGPELAGTVLALERAGLTLIALLARRALANVTREHQQLVQADAALVHLGVREPSRLAAIFVPGFD
jgi:eukaryotic-like serine/threonine-protein kinase